jgi:hypothetical protein
MEQFSDDDIDAGVDKVIFSINIIQLNEKLFLLEMIFYLVQ